MQRKYSTYHTCPTPNSATSTCFLKYTGRIPPCNPIVSGIGRVAERVLDFVDNFINNIPANFLSYVRDANHFLQKLSSLNISDNAFLVTIDVTSLYIDIPHQDGITAVSESYEQVDHKFVDADVPSMLTKLVFVNNHFEFENKRLLQINITVMGRWLLATQNYLWHNWRKTFSHSAPTNPCLTK